MSRKRRICAANIHEGVSHPSGSVHPSHCTSSRSRSRDRGPVRLRRGWYISGSYSRLDLVNGDRILDSLNITRVLTF